jgi:1-acyl-sn-glycerol-3-phosphate acyltransferase
MKPRGTVVHMRPRAVAAAAADPETERLRQRVEELESALRGQGPLFALLRLLRAGRHGVNWENVARLWAALYFSWHSEETDEFGYDRKFTETVMPVFEFLYTVWWRVEVAGVESVPESGPGLIVANHSGVLPYDGLMIRLAVRHEHPARREARLLALDMFALLPFLAPLLQRTGAVRASQENGERLLRGGELVGVFPEGVKGVGKPFRNRYKLARFGRGGFVRLALRAGAPLVPCAVVGAEEIHPNLMTANWVGRPLGLPYLPITPTFPLLGPLGLFPLPVRYRIHFGEPLRFEGDAGDEDAVIEEKVEQVRGAIGALLEHGRAERPAVFL